MKIPALILAIPFLLFSAAEIGAAPRPNILYLYVDDMGWGALGPNGQAARKEAGLASVSTPNLDRLAAESINFSRGYGCTVCSPARSSQQTGFHQGHTFADRNDPDNAKKAMRADDVTMGDALSRAGYLTGYWGKWGYGGSRDMRNPTLDNIQTLPTSHGYQHVVAELHHVRAHTFFQPTLWSAPAAPGAEGGLELIPNSMTRFREKGRYPTTPALQDHGEYPEVAYCDDVYCFAALDFVREGAERYREKGQPFFGLLAVQVPHAPFDEIEQLPEWDRAYRDNPHFSGLSDQTRQWMAMVTRIDGHIGNLLDALEDPNGDGDRSDSVADDTLVIFQSDNGGPGGPALKELDTNGGLRGTKGSIYEGGIRVPTLVRWRDRIHAESRLRAGTTTDLLVDVSDLLPTFCELAGVETPVGLDGVSIAPWLTGEGERRERRYLIHEAGRNQSIIAGRLKLVRTPKGAELYDLIDDPGEETNLASTKPKIVSKLEALLLAERVDEPRGFANTYHHWIGKNGAKASLADHWTDYEYTNAGLTYLTDDGPPQLSWTATMANTGEKPSVAIGDSDLAFLGLEIRGGGSDSATQELRMQPGTDLVGRNEIRISAGGILAFDGGAVRSERWIDVRKGGRLRGSGTLDATVYNEGTLEVVESNPAARRGLEMVGDYRESASSELHLAPVGVRGPMLRIANTARLAGRLVLSGTDREPGEGRKRIILLKAGKIEGAFSKVVAEGFEQGRIEYTESEVVWVGGSRRDS